MAQVQRVVQARTPAPTFGQLFGQALARNIGAPARQARQDRADFLKIAPTLVNNKVLTTTSADDPDAVQIGGKPVSIGGVSFKSTTPPVDTKEQLEIVKLIQEINTSGKPSVNSLTDAYNDEVYGPGGIMLQGYNKQIETARKAGDNNLVRQLTAERDAKYASGLQNFINANRAGGALSLTPAGVVGVGIQDPSGQFRTMTQEEMTTPGFFQGAQEDQQTTQQTSKARQSALKQFGKVSIEAGKSAAEAGRGFVDFAKRNPATAMAAAFYGGKGALNVGKQVVSPFLSGALPGGPLQSFFAPKAPLSAVQAGAQRAGLRAGSLLGPAARMAGPVVAGTAIGQELGTNVLGPLQTQLLPQLTGAFADPLRYITDPAYREFTSNLGPISPEEVPQAGFFESLNPFTSPAAQELRQTQFPVGR